MSEFPQWAVISAIVFAIAALIIFMAYKDIPFVRFKPPTVPLPPPGEKDKLTFTTWKEDKLNHVWLGFNEDGKMVAKIYRVKESNINLVECCYVELNEKEAYLSIKQAKEAVDTYNWLQRVSLPA